MSRQHRSQTVEVKGRDDWHDVQLAFDDLINDIEADHPMDVAVSLEVSEHE